VARQADKTMQPEEMFGQYDPRTIFFPVSPDAWDYCASCGTRLLSKASGYTRQFSSSGFVSFLADPEPDEVEHTVCAACDEAIKQAGGDEEMFLDWQRERCRQVMGQICRGVAYYRVITDRRLYGMTLEAAYAEAWEKVNREDSWLAKLLRVPCKRGDQGATPEYGIVNANTRRALEDGMTHRDAAVASTVIQWLGSNVGQDFVKDVLASQGYQVLRRER
jgi:hypothetical protein